MQTPSTKEYRIVGAHTWFDLQQQIEDKADEGFDVVQVIVDSSPDREAHEWKFVAVMAKPHEIH